ncbi:MAG TPA: response regulator [Candidatus Chromulinivoraceae bacterium]|nr:response regulator [Candidatus Chromulinivoraceae bacterium]
MAGLQKILLVEDNIELRSIYEQYLKRRGYTVTVAVDGEDALRLGKEFRPELVFLDIMMPKIDGLKVLKMLRHDEEYGCTRAKIVLLTNLGDASRVDPKVQKDMDGYVIKAEINLSDLIDIIKSFEGLETKQNSAE